MAFNRLKRWILGLTLIGAAPYVTLKTSEVISTVVEHRRNSVIDDIISYSTNAVDASEKRDFTTANDLMKKVKDRLSDTSSPTDKVFLVNFVDIISGIISANEFMANSKYKEAIERLRAANVSMRKIPAEYLINLRYPIGLKLNQGTIIAQQGLETQKENEVIKKVEEIYVKAFADFQREKFKSSKSRLNTAIRLLNKGGIDPQSQISHKIRYMDQLAGYFLLIPDKINIGDHKAVSKYLPQVDNIAGMIPLSPEHRTIILEKITRLKEKIS